MKNTLIAAAVAAVFAAPAFADTTLYGQGHVSLDSVSADGVADNDLSLASNSSRIGVKGSHKLSDSLSAVYKMEWAVNVDGEGSDMGQRNRYVGLSGGFGTVVFGRHDTPMKGIGNKYELFWGGTQMGSAIPLLAGGGFHARLDNVIGYMNSFGPVNVFAAYSTAVSGNETTADDNGVSIALGVGKGKPFSVDLAYELHNGEVYGTTNDATAVRLGGAYNIGAVKLVAQFTQETDMKGVADADRTTAGVGAALKMGKNTLKAQYFMADVDVVAGAPSADSSVVSLGIDHKLSKLATIYATYAAASNDAAASTALGGSGHGNSEKYTPVAGGDVDGFSLGLQVKF